MCDRSVVITATSDRRLRPGPRRAQAACPWKDESARFGQMHKQACAKSTMGIFRIHKYVHWWSHRDLRSCCMCRKGCFRLLQGPIHAGSLSQLKQSSLVTPKFAFIKHVLSEAWYSLISIPCTYKMIYLQNALAARDLSITHLQDDSNH